MATPVSAASVNNICPKVYETGQYSSTAEDKASELTLLLQSLLVYGVFESLAEAVAADVPAGTFVIVDDPETPDLDFTVQVVPQPPRV